MTIIMKTDILEII